MKKAASLWMVVAAVSLAGVSLRAASEKGPSKRPGYPATEAASGSPSSNSPRGQFQEREPRYQVGKSDVLEINFPFTPELNQTVTVQPDGFVALRGVAYLHVAGLTVPEVRESLKKAYSSNSRRTAITSGWRMQKGSSVNSAKAMTRWPRKPIGTWRCRR
jgi:protein involved in polysaccharide export with SLBB domain